MANASEAIRGGKLDCFVACACRNDGIGAPHPAHTLKIVSPRISSTRKITTKT